MDVLKIIADNSLTVRCLPKIVVSHWSYNESAEKTIHHKCFDSDGNPIDVKKSIVVGPTGRKMIREERVVRNGGWWYVKATPNTDCTVRFERKYDKFFAPTLEEAITLYLNRNNNK